jgi:hypothetical protein
VARRVPDLRRIRDQFRKRLVEENSMAPSMAPKRAFLSNSMLPGGGHSWAQHQHHTYDYNAEGTDA